MENLTNFNDTMDTEIMNAEILGDVEGQEAEFKADAGRQVIEAVGEFLSVGTQDELAELIQVSI